MKKPDFVETEDGKRVSDWVLGIYYKNTICKFRVIRYIEEGGTFSWEYADQMAECEDLWQIPEPGHWVPIDEKRGL